MGQLDSDDLFRRGLGIDVYSERNLFPGYTEEEGRAASQGNWG